MTDRAAGDPPGEATIVADQLLDIDMLKELSKGNFEPGPARQGR
ncbi:hypothetical protein [Micromonospora sp. IBHARD004]